MKIIPKFANGGGFDSLFTLYTPSSSGRPAGNQALSSGRSTRLSSNNDDDEKGKITQKDLLNMIKDIDGLPNEMLAITTNLINTMKLADLGVGSVNDLATTYLKNLYQVKLAILNKKDYKEALKTAKDNGAMNEPAISTDGRIVVQTPLGLGFVSLQELHNSGNIYKPLTVSQLANMRAYQPSLKGNTDVLDIINNSIGYEGFLALLKLGIRSLGSTETQENRITGLDYRQTQLLLTKLATLTPEKREEVLTGVSSESIFSREQMTQLNALKTYLSSLLPLRMLVWAAYKLNMDDPRKATEALITSYLIAGANSSERRTLDLSNYVSKNTKTKDSKESGKDAETGYSNDFKPNEAIKFLMGLGSQEILTINPGKNSAILVFTRTLPITKKDGSPIGSNSSLLDVTLTSFGNIMDLRYASVAGKIINPALYGQVILNDGKLSSVDFPYHKDEFGRILPDTNSEINAKKEKANSILRNLGIDITKPEDIKKNYAKINLVYESLELNPKYDASGLPTNWMRFGVLNATVTGNVVGDDFDSSLLYEVTSDLADAIESVILKNDKNYNNPTHGGFMGFGASDAIYQGTVWIPILKHAYQAASSGEDYKLSDVLLMERDMTANENYQNNRAQYDENKERYGFKPGVRV